jgi:hypothetical protein
VAHKAGYKVVQENNAGKLGIELNKLGEQGWKPILMSATHAVVGPAGQGHLITTVILEHQLGA